LTTALLLDYDFTAKRYVSYDHPEMLMLTLLLDLSARMLSH